MRLASSGSKDQRGKNMKWWLLVLADCIQFKNNPRVISIFITEPSTGPVGCFKCFKWNQSRTPETLRYRRKRVSKKMPKTFVSLSPPHPHPIQVNTHTHSNTHITIWNQTALISVTKYTSPETIFFQFTTCILPLRRISSFPVLYVWLHVCISLS